METIKYSARSIAAKQIVAIESGSILNGLASCTISPKEKYFCGLSIEDQGTMKWIPIESIRSFTADVVIVDAVQQETIKGINPIGMPAVTQEGRLIGRIIDVAFDQEGRLMEILLDGGIVSEKNKRPGILSIINVDVIGKDVFICSIDLESPSFAEADKEVYKLALSKASRKKSNDSKETLKYEEIFDQITQHVSSSMNELGSRISDRLRNMDRDSISQELNRFTDGLNREAGKFMDGFIEQFVAHKKEVNQKDVDAVLNDLAGNTVKRPVNDKNGQVIIMPGQLINEEKVRAVMTADKVAELYRMAVPLDDKEAEEHDA